MLGGGRVKSGVFGRMPGGTTAYVYIPHGPLVSPVISTRMNPYSPQPEPKLQNGIIKIAKTIIS